MNTPTIVTQAVTQKAKERFVVPTAVKAFKRVRFEWALELLDVYGFVGPVHIERKFDISLSTASNDIEELCLLAPHLFFDKSINAVRKVS